MDVFWFRVPKPRDTENRTTGVFAAGRIVALIDRGDYWQCAFVFAKGGADASARAGIDASARESSRRRRCSAPRSPRLRAGTTSSC